jgi:tetratricopeptide (TPR) repeat protein
MYNESLAAYNRTVAADPASFAAWMGKGSAETALGMFESALSSLDRAAKIKPGDPDPWVSRGEVLLAAGDPAAAAAAFDRALVIHPGLASALDGKARAQNLEQLLSSPVPEETPAPGKTPAGQPGTPVPGNATPAGTGEQAQKSPLAPVSLALAFLVPAVLASRRRG